MHYVDTNIFLRYLTNDDPQKAQQCYALFQKADAGEIQLVTTEAVITEIVYVLSSKKWYALSRERIRALLYPLLQVKGLKISSRRVYLRALGIYALFQIDFEDAIIIARMEAQKIRELYSYDGGLDKVPTITRREP